MRCVRDQGSKTHSGNGEATHNEEATHRDTGSLWGPHFEGPAGHQQFLTSHRRASRRVLRVEPSELPRDADAPHWPVRAREAVGFLEDWAEEAADVVVGEAVEAVWAGASPALYLKAAAKVRLMDWFSAPLLWCAVGLVEGRGGSGSASGDGW